MAEALRGKHGWLFLTADRNQVLRQHSGDLLFSETDLQRWQETLESRREWLQERGIPYHYLVVPNKESVYPEELPDEISSNGQRPIGQLRDHLIRARSPFSFIYPLAELQAEKQRSEVYIRTDTHWNALGAFIGYSRLAREVEQTAPIRVVTPEEVQFYEYEHLKAGDLGSKLDPPEKSVRLRRLIYDHPARVIYDNAINNIGRVVEFESGDLTGTTCVFFGDSFAFRLLSYVAQSFARVVFAYRDTFDRALIEKERPDVVISQSIERFMIDVPDDADAPPTEELARRKRAQGDIVPAERVEGFADHFRAGPEPGAVAIPWP